MQKTILLTGATDGIGLETAKMLVSMNHNLLLHGRNRSKLEKVAKELSDLSGEGRLESYVADLSIMAEVEGSDLRIGAEIVCRASLSDEFGAASGQYFDNDIGRFAQPHPDALDPQKCREVVRLIEAILAQTN